MYQILSERTVLLYRWVREVVLPETATPKVREPVSGVALISHPDALSERATIWPSSGGLAAALTQALHVMLPAIRKEDDAPRST